jgi:multidrug efflux pump subunit AcrB
MYERCLKLVLRHQFATLAASFLLLIGTIYLYALVPKGFLPSEDIEQFNITTEAVEGISYESMIEHQKQAAEIVMQEPAVGSAVHDHDDVSRKCPSISIVLHGLGNVGADVDPRHLPDIGHSV